MNRLFLCALITKGRENLCSSMHSSIVFKIRFTSVKCTVDPEMNASVNPLLSDFYG